MSDVQPLTEYWLKQEFGTITADRAQLNFGVRVYDDFAHHPTAIATTLDGLRKRVGDAPVIGAGTYADNRSCAVSATGAGEYFIRVGVAQEICTRLRLAWNDLVEEAEESVPRDELGFPEYAVHASELWLDEDDVRQVADEVLAEVKDLGGDGGAREVAIEDQEWI